MSELKMSIGKYKGYTLDTIPQHYKRWFVVNMDCKNDELKEIYRVMLTSVQMMIRRDPNLSKEDKRVELIKLNNQIREATNNRVVINNKPVYEYTEA